MENERIATDLLTPLWLGIDSDYKKKYSYTIWQQFQDNIQSAAYTSTLSKFLSMIMQRLGIEIKSAYVEKLTTVINSGEDKSILKALRSDTALLVLMVRVANEEKKEAKKEKAAPVKAALNNLFENTGESI